MKLALLFFFYAVSLVSSFVMGYALARIRYHKQMLRFWIAVGASMDAGHFPLFYPSEISVLLDDADESKVPLP